MRVERKTVFAGLIRQVSFPNGLRVGVVEHGLEKEIALEIEWMYASIPATVTSAARLAETKASPEEKQLSSREKSGKNFCNLVQSALSKCQFWRLKGVAGGCGAVSKEKFIKVKSDELIPGEIVQLQH